MIRPPASHSPEVLTDWAEACCLFGERKFLSDHLLERTLQDVAMKNAEKTLSRIRQQVRMREHKGREAYPVATRLAGLERTTSWSGTLAYSFQLLLACVSRYGAVPHYGAEWLRSAKLFERLSASALAHYLGGEAVVIGAPRIDDDQVPEGFSDCLDFLCGRLGEERGQKKVYTSHTKEDGVDVVAWAPFADRRAGQVVVLAQSAAGLNWKDKARDPKLDTWRQHINWLARPLGGFAFPFVCIDDLTWRRLSYDCGGFILDRLRIASVLAATDAVPGTLRKDLQAWCDEHVLLLPWLDAR